MSANIEGKYTGDKIQAGSETVTVGEEIDSGTEGTVYHVREEKKKSVVKIFSEDRREQKADKIQTMLANKPDDPTKDEHGVPSIIWPEDPVRENSPDGEFLGYKMAYRDLDEAENAYKHAMVSLDWNNSTPEDRYTTALNLVLMVYAIHNEGHAIGDFNDDNILIDDGFVTLIDCDAFTISDGDTTYPGETFYPRYSPPEGRPTKLEEVQEFDRFCLGVHIFQLLMSGFHPYQAKGPEATAGSSEDWITENKFPYDNQGYEPHDSAPEYETLPAELRSLFSKCFSEESKQNQDYVYDEPRPKPSEWIDAFAFILDEEVNFSKPSNGLATSKGVDSTNTTNTGESEETHNKSISYKKNSDNNWSIDNSKYNSLSYINIIILYIGKAEKGSEVINMMAVLKNEFIRMIYHLLFLLIVAGLLYLIL